MKFVAQILLAVVFASDGERVRQADTWSGLSAGGGSAVGADAVLREARNTAPTGGDTPQPVVDAATSATGNYSAADLDQETLQLQMLVAENRWRDVPDHAAQLHAIDRLAKRSGLTMREAIVGHVSQFTNGFPAHSRWITKLDTSCSRPDGFKVSADRWQIAYFRRCSLLVRKVRDFNAGKLPDPCKGEPDQWRSRRFPKLQRAAARRGWRRIGCGRDSLHVFWDTGKR